MKTIPLTRGLEAIVDDEDFCRVAARTWQAKPALSKNGRQLGWYVQRRDAGKTVYLHRFVLSAATGFLVDHINGDGLDNRRSNLRICSRAQNRANSVGRIGVSGYRGVHRTKNERWYARIEIDGRARSVGVFDDPKDAARAYDAAALELFGAFAVLNFPDAANDDRAHRRAA